MSFRKIGIIGAMTEEIELLHKHAHIASEITKAGITYYSGTLNGKDVIFCRSGVGKVNAAVCTQLLVDLGVDCVLFTGVAGALDPKLQIGDIVVSSSCVQHDMDCSPLGFERGVIPYHPSSEFIADERLVKLAGAAAEKLFAGRYVLGRVLSGDQFVASRDTVKLLHESLHGACVEMEGSSVAQVCVMNEVPFVVIRSMSDQADGSAHVNFAEFTVKAANNSYAIIEDIINHM